MKKTIKKRLVTILLLFTLMLPYASSDIDCGSLSNPQSDAEIASCCNTFGEPDEKPTIIDPN